MQENPLEEPKFSQEPQNSEPQVLPEESAKKVDYIEIYSASAWNDFARKFNNEREKYDDSITVVITNSLNFENMDFVPLADGFSGRIIGTEHEMTADQRKLWIAERKKWPLDYNGTFINIGRVEVVNGEIPSSLFGSVRELELENVSFAFIYLDDVKCLFTENADALKLYNVQVQNCLLADGHSIVAGNAGSISVEGFIAESCFLTGYEYMAGLVSFVSGDAQFRDVFLCRSNLTLSPDNGGSGLGSAGIGVLAKSINGTASFENIAIYACNTTGLYTNALAGSVGGVSKCSNISLDFCTFINYRPTESEFKSGLISSCGEMSFMDMPVLEENVSITNCNIGGEFIEEDFVARGYHVENCVFTSSIKEPPQ